MPLFRNFFFNGQEYGTLSLGFITLEELISYFGYKSTLFIIEYNNSICHQSEWNKIKIKTNDKIELITIVGGG